MTFRLGTSFLSLLYPRGHSPKLKRRNFRLTRRGSTSAFLVVAARNRLPRYAMYVPPVSAFKQRVDGCWSCVFGVKFFFILRIIVYWYVLPRLYVTCLSMFDVCIIKLLSPCSIPLHNSWAHEKIRRRSIQWNTLTFAAIVLSHCLLLFNTLDILCGIKRITLLCTNKSLIWETCNTRSAKTWCGKSHSCFRSQKVPPTRQHWL